jgi:hypothetical protein
MGETAPRRAYSAEDARAALTAHFGGDGAIIMHEVGNGTGHRAVPRWADMMVMETWPSRGYCIHGIEIKVARSDWKKELATPAKADAMFAHCDRWWLASTPGVVENIDEIPSTWGWLEIAPGRDGTLLVATMRQAPPQDRKPAIQREIVAAMLRANERRARTINDRMIREEVERRIEAERARLAEQRTRDRADNAPLLEVLRREIGRDSMWLTSESVVRAFTIVHKAELHNGYNRITQALSSLRGAAEAAGGLATALEAHLADLGLHVPKPPEPRKRTRKPL